MEIKSIEWGAWKLAPEMGEGVQECRGVVTVEGFVDVIFVDVSASRDATPVYTLMWRSNGHTPTDPELTHALGEAATERADGLEREGLPAIFDCGCSLHKIQLGRCDVYAPDGTERPERGDASTWSIIAGGAPLDHGLRLVRDGESFGVEIAAPLELDVARALADVVPEPDPPQDAIGAASERANAAAARDLAELEPDTWGLDLSLVPRAMRPAIRQIEELALQIEATHDEGERAELEARLAEGGRDTVLAIGIYCHVLGLAVGQVQAEATRLGARASRFKDRGQRLRRIGRAALDTMGVDKPIESPTITVGPSTGKPRVVVAPTFDCDLLPAELVRRPPAEPVKAALAKLLRNNPNAYPGISLVPGEPTMRIYK